MNGTDFLARPDLHALYNRYLVDLIGHKSLFTYDEGIQQALRYCHDVIRTANDARRTYFDEAGNLVSISNRFDTRRNALYLSAHIDTVDANPAEWRSSTDPFKAVETPTHIIGRGANDCKAGVALMLLFSQMQGLLPLDNVVFLFSYREEGNRAKTSVQIGKDLGGVIPLSDAGNIVLCLENTIKIDQDRYFIEIYDCEPCNVFISITDYLPNIRQFLIANPKWKPVFIKPVGGTSQLAFASSRSGTSGHVATVENAGNVIYDAIIHSHDQALNGGDDLQTSVVDNHVDLFDAPVPALHQVILNCRSVMTVEELKQSISRLNYREYHPFEFGSGSDRRVKLERSFVKQLIRDMPCERIQPRFMCNPGRSDASAIWNTTKHQDKIDILTMGPGTRAHADHGIMRKTHGPDEGFHKQSGHLAIDYILNLAEKILSA
jgi:hypothetical protein